MNNSDKKTIPTSDIEHKDKDSFTFRMQSYAHELVRAEKMEERKMERAAEKDMGDTKNVLEEKSSLSDRIAGKKKQIDEKHEPKKAHDKNKDTSL